MATVKHKPPPLEVNLEARCVAWVKRRCPTAEAVKLNTRFRAHWPDRMFILPHGRVVFVEFKREGKMPTAAQAEVHTKLARLGHFIYWTTTFENFVLTMEPFV